MAAPYAQPMPGQYAAPAPMPGQYAAPAPMPGQYAAPVQMPGQPGPAPAGNYAYGAPAAAPMMAAPVQQAHPLILQPGAVAPTDGVCILGPNYCFPTQTVLVLKEVPSASGDDFVCYDNTGRIWFKLDAKAFSLRAQRSLQDYNGAPVCTLNKKLVSIGDTWNMFPQKDVEGKKLLTLEKKILTFSPMIEIFLNKDGPKGLPDFKAKGDWASGTRFEIYQKTNGQKKILAECTKSNLWGNLSPFMQSLINSKDTYYLNISPNVDVAFIVSICVLIDEMYHDEEH